MLLVHISIVAIESYFHWNGPQAHHAQSYGEAALDRRFFSEV